MSFLFPLQMEQTGHQQYEKTKGKTTLQSWGLFSSSPPSTKIYVCLRKPGKAVTTKWQKTVYMFSNIFVLYYIQLSLLKMEYRWLLYCRTEKRSTVQTAPCHLQDCDMACRGSVCHGLREKRWIGAVLKGFCPLSYSSFPPALEQGLFPENTLTDTAPLHHIMHRFKKFPARFKALFY